MSFGRIARAHASSCVSVLLVGKWHIIHRRSCHCVCFDCRRRLPPPPLSPAYIQQQQQKTITNRRWRIDDAVHITRPFSPLRPNPDKSFCAKLNENCFFFLVGNFVFYCILCLVCRCHSEFDSGFFSFCICPRLITRIIKWLFIYLFIVDGWAGDHPLYFRSVIVLRSNVCRSSSEWRQTRQRWFN